MDFQALIRVQPMVAPILNNLTVDLHAFFVPTRLLWKLWEDFITTIKQDSIPPENFEGTPPVWTEKEDGTVSDIDTSSHSLWDMFGFSRKFDPKTPKERRPLDFLRRAYILIYNHWFRDENLQEPIDYNNSDLQTLLYRAWRKDYLTAGFTSRQKGVAPSIPLTGTGSAAFTFLQRQIESMSSQVLAYKNTMSDGEGLEALDADLNLKLDEILTNTNKIDLSDIGTFDVNDLRDMFQIQKFMELLMRAGSRYIEFLQSQFGVSPSDARLQIPERIGGSSFNINISEVIQTSETTRGEFPSPQGNQSGHGLSVSEGSCGNYHCEEFGYIIILGNIQPPAVYTDRMPRSMFRKTLLEQFNPHFVNLGYQSVHKREVFSDGTEADDDVFSYQGRYDELREQLSYISGDLYDKLSYYLNFRKFDNTPGFNKDFIECKPDNDIFIVQNEPPFICNFYFNHKVLRPLPLFSQPGLIDHVYGGL